MADIESPNPTVFKGFLQTKTGLNEKWLLPKDHDITGSEALNCRISSPENILNSSGMRSVTFSDSSVGISQACLPAMRLPAATAESTFSQEDDT